MKPKVKIVGQEADTCASSGCGTAVDCYCGATASLCLRQGTQRKLAEVEVGGTSRRQQEMPRRDRTSDDGSAIETLLWEATHSSGNGPLGTPAMSSSSERSRRVQASSVGLSAHRTHN